MSPKRARTVSEDLLEDLCAQVGIGCTPVEEGKSRTPDYELELSGHRVVAEVKQFDPNPEEAESIKKMKAGGVGGVSAVPGDRIRKAIHSAAPQLRALSEGKCPSMVVVYNNSGVTHRGKEPDAVKRVFLECPKKTIEMERVDHGKLGELRPADYKDVVLKFLPGRSVQLERMRLVIQTVRGMEADAVFEHSASVWRPPDLWDNFTPY